jgi:hypothetical protein
MLSPIELPVHLTPDAPMKLRQPILLRRMGCLPVESETLMGLVIAQGLWLLRRTLRDQEQG